MNTLVKLQARTFEHNLFIEGMPVVTDKKNLLGLGFQIGISEALQNESDSVSYFAEQGTDVLNEILEPRELQDMKNFMDEKKQKIIEGFDKEIKELDSDSRSALINFCGFFNNSSISATASLSNAISSSYLAFIDLICLSFSSNFDSIFLPVISKVE